MGSSPSKPQPHQAWTREQRVGGRQHKSASVNNLVDPIYATPAAWVGRGGRQPNRRVKDEQTATKIKHWHSTFDISSQSDEDRYEDADLEDRRSLVSYAIRDFGNVNNNNANSVASSYRNGTVSSTSSYPTTTKGSVVSKSSDYPSMTQHTRAHHKNSPRTTQYNSHARGNPMGGDVHYKTPRMNRKADVVPEKTPRSNRKADTSDRHGKSNKKLSLSPSLFSNDDREPTWKQQMPVSGQGTLFFTILRNTPFVIVVRKDGSDNYISLDITKKGAFFNKTLRDKKVTVAAIDDEKAGFQKNTNVRYWLSYDRDSLTVKYGKGYMMDEAVLLSFCFIENKTKAEEKEIRRAMYELFNPEQMRYVELYDADEPEKLRTYYQKYITSLTGTDQRAQNLITMAKVLDIESKVDMNKNPLISNRPSYILDSGRTNLFQLDRGDYTFSASLPPAAKELYENVKMCELNWPEEVDGILLSDAIRYSIETRGGMLNDKLKEKGKAGFDKKPNMLQTYLRITLGHSLGASPGIPYVLEIWPSKHYSPIHNHGHASAVIKVLHGSIHARIFNRISRDIDGKEEKPQLLKEFDGEVGDITWMDRNWYQTHQLENITDDFCATVQCYNYDEKDNVHWPYFNYINEKSKISEFLPNTDFTFMEMRDKVLAEFRNSKRMKKP